MAFTYPTGSDYTSLTPPSRPLYCKSIKIDIAAGSGFTSGSTYSIGRLPKGSQVIGGNIVVPVAVSGGTVSVATITVRSGGQQIASAVNVFSTGAPSLGPVIYTQNTGWTFDGDQEINYTPTLTGAGATAGIMYVNIYYVQ